MRGGQPLSSVLAVIVHQEADRAAVHPVDRLAGTMACSVCSISPSPPSATTTSALGRSRRRSGRRAAPRLLASGIGLAMKAILIVRARRLMAARLPNVRPRSSPQKEKDMERAVFVYTTYPSIVEAEQAGRAIVERRLAACVNILPGMISHYWWQGALERGEEAAMIIKTRASLTAAVHGASRRCTPMRLRHHGDPARERGPELPRLDHGGDGEAACGLSSSANLPARRAHHFRPRGHGAVPHPTPPFLPLPPLRATQYVVVPSITPLSLTYSSHVSLPQIRLDLLQVSCAIRALPCSACHMP